jgi:hypothetical protein
MLITRRPSLPGVAGREDAWASAPSAFTPTSPGESSANDRVDLSDAARLRQRLQADLGDLQRTDTERVASLRTRIVTDAYKPAPEAVAESLIGELTADLLSELASLAMKDAPLATVRLVQLQTALRATLAAGSTLQRSILD